ncbi:efflux RND transporter periplasmic adaptor subunit [Sandaracinus amylolyticus]|uniref:efflux RND transporter periplasmic adaptor subunit n=1 Tax=Sandaracinus amylolyticus TaxID=927083 RepID=UPI001F27D5F9|nr:HlyD family efflux transporter periplasmic adaptor subunit [Sandaracinus amylolyticus]UJR79586.1 Efflux RND transporter periplasmic adaptor subunit [Sandaracinus amylolyticus]
MADPTTKRNGKRALRRWARRSLTAIFLLGVLAAIVIAMMPRPIEVDTAVVRRGTMRVTIDEDGRTRVKDRYVVSAPLTGNVARIELHPGDMVRQGDVLARLVPLSPPLLDARTRAEAEARLSAAMAQERQARSSIERIETALEFATHEADRARRLAAQGGIPGQQLDRAEMELRTRREELTSVQFGARVATHEVQLARAALGRFEPRVAAAQQESLDVTAPVDGVVLRVAQESGGVVQAGAPLLEIGDPSALEIAVDVLTSDAVRIPVGARVELDRWGGEGVLEGRVRMVEPSAFTRVSALGVEEQRVNVVIDLDAPRERWAALGDGFRVEAHIVVSSEDGVLIVPSTAVWRHGSGWAVFVVRDGRAARVSVDTGARNGVDVEIRSGVSEGEDVIVHPSDRVVDSVRVSGR